METKEKVMDEKESPTVRVVEEQPKKTDAEILKDYQAKTKLQYQKEVIDAKKQALVDLEKDKYYQRISNFLKINGFPDLSMEETKSFVATCQTTGLNPFKREIYAIPFNKTNASGDAVRSIMPVISYEVVVRAYRKVYPNDRFNSKFEGEGEDMKIIFSVDRWIDSKGDFVKDFWTPGYAVPIMEYAKTKYNYTTKKKEMADVWKAHPQQMLTKCLVKRAISYLMPEADHGLYCEDEVANVQQPVTNNTHSQGYVERLRHK